MTRLLATALLLLPVGGTALAQGQEGKVEANDQLKFAPETITVPVGGKVTWTNVGSSFHTVTGGENGSADPDSPVGNGTLAAKDATYSITFKKAGRYPYYCAPHVANGMVGTVVVGNAPSPAASVTPSAPVSPSGPAPVPGGTDSDPETEGHGGEVPGIDGNRQLAKLDEERAAAERTLGGFRAFTWAATAAMVALGVALFASTRTRRGGR